MEEIWKPIPGYENFYLVSNTGKVKNSITNLIRKQRLNNKYYSIRLFKNGIWQEIKIHQLVAMAFLGHVRNGHNLVVDHIDGNKLNNNLQNLRVISGYENLVFLKPVNPSFPRGVFKKPNGKFGCNIAINKKRINLGTFDTPEEAGQAYQQKRKTL